MHRSVSETRRSVATRPYRSSRGRVVTVAVTLGSLRAGPHQARTGRTRTAAGARLTSRACGRCGSWSAGAGSCSRSRWPCWRGPPGCSASGSSTGWRTARSSTRSSPGTSRHPQPRSRRSSRRTARSPRPRSGGWSRRRGAMPPTTPSSSATAPARAPRGATWSSRWSPPRDLPCWLTAAGSPPTTAAPTRSTSPPHRPARSRSPDGSAWTRPATARWSRTGRPATPCPRARSRATGSVRPSTGRCTAGSST